MSVFDVYRKEAWPYEFKVTLHVGTLSGGVPANEKVAEGWLRSKLAEPDHIMRARLTEAMADRLGTGGGENGGTVVADVVDEVIEEDVAGQHLNGFKRDERGLFIEGRQVKAAIKEAASAAVAGDKLKKGGWGKTNKGLLSFVAEHVVVVEDRIYLDRVEAEGVHQRFISKVIPGRGKISAIHYEEYVTEVDVEFTLRTDFEFTEQQWAMLWLTGEEQGIGASRSQGFGRYEVTRWESVE